MAIVETARTAPFGAVAIHTAVSAVYRVADAVLAWDEARRAEKQLRSLSTRQLDDIGLAPGDITGIVERMIARAR